MKKTLRERLIDCKNKYIGERNQVIIGIEVCGENKSWEQAFKYNLRKIQLDAFILELEELIEN
jgi:hypothetical protein